MKKYNCLLVFVFTFSIFGDVIDVPVDSILASNPATETLAAGDVFEDGLSTLSVILEEGCEGNLASSVDNLPISGDNLPSGDAPIMPPPYVSSGLVFMPYFNVVRGKSPWIPDSYTTAGFFLQLPHATSDLIFQGDILQSARNRRGASIGVGARFFRSAGLNLFYDNLQGHIGNFHQIGMGFEAFNVRGYDVRLNFYVPVSSKRESNPVHYFYPLGDYEATCLEKERAAAVCSGQIIRPFKLAGPISANVSIGAYNIHAHNSRGVGFILGGSVDYRSLVFLKINSYYDNFYKYNVQGCLTIALPIRSNNFNKKTPIIERFDAILLRKNCCWTWNW